MLVQRGFGFIELLVEVHDRGLLVEQRFESRCRRARFEPGEVSTRWSRAASSASARSSWSGSRSAPYPGKTGSRRRAAA